MTAKANIPSLFRHLRQSLCLQIALVLSLPLQAAPDVSELRPLGEVFTLLQRREDANVESEEYVPKGETQQSWSRLLGIQRIRRQTSPAELSAYLQKSLTSRHRARVTVLHRGEHACLLSASIPASPEAEAEELLCYVSLSLERPGQLEALHYSLRPSRVEESVAALQLQCWRERLLAQAGRRNAGAAASARPGE